ncbi:MAG: nitroreductase family protein [Desulfuromonadales bacterium]|nr:nitroreductase family protein [Desulfuromonadales bacterium]
MQKNNVRAEALEKMRTQHTAVEQVILRRRSVRRYKQEQVPEWMVHRILEAGRFAPSSGNCQPWKFVVVRDKKIIDELSADVMQIARSYNRMLDYRSNRSWWRRKLANLMIRRMPNMLHPTPFGVTKLFSDGVIGLYHDAPTAILIFKDVRGIASPDLDNGIAGQNMVLAAHSMGLGTCWVGFTKLAFEKKPKWNKLFGIDYPYAFANSIAIGWPQGEADGMVPRPLHPIDWFEDGTAKTFFADGVRRSLPASERKVIPDYGDKALFPPGEIAVDNDKCNGCGLCVKICPVGALETQQKSVIMKAPEEHECFLCGACYSICPTEAIQTVAGPGYSGRFTDLDRGALTLPQLAP